ncbi:hypothetical protein V1525DRAFT_424267 [Lipomyces kononenkoae]|uniref:Uncharacterized protein n=1 Tax=Lipomyces kononenkoae TaxID=34357 RepID=A0ACC3T7B3_LIPKO
MSSLSENDVQRKEDDSLSKYSVSAPISPRSSEPTPSPSPSSSSSSLSNYKSLAKLRKRVASALFSSSSQKEDQAERLSASQSSSDVNVMDSRPSLTPLATSPVPVAASGTSSPLTRSFSNLSHSSNSTTTSSALRGRPRSQTLSSLDTERRNRRESQQLNQITSITNILSLRLRSDSEPNFAELKTRQDSGIPQRSQTPRQSGPLLPLALLDTKLPDRHDGESAADYLKRAEALVSRNYIAHLLSKSDDEFYQTVLRMFCNKFNFVDDPIDMALRKFLLVVQLPRESQQIDRVLDAFAQRYHYCNPEVYISKDQAYVITFSLMILHTDAFNKSNKHKMQRPEYVRNTQVDGVASEVLECFFDNITYTPFIHMDEEIYSTPTYSEKLSERLSFSKPRKSLTIGKPTKEPEDPYVLIAENRLQDVRPALSEVLNLEDPYSYVGTAPQFEVKSLHREFINGPLLQILPPRPRQPLLVSPEIGFPSYVIQPDHTMTYIKVAKIGVLTSLERKKKKSSKAHWRSWGVVLTLSRVYFFKDVNWVRGLMDQLDATMAADEKAEPGHQAPYLFPPIQGFHADEVMSTQSMIALLDRSYTGRRHAFVMIAKGGVQDWFVADSEGEMNDWITKLNYAAALNSSGANMQGVEKSADGNPDLHHLVDILTALHTGLPSMMRSPANEKSNVVFSSLFYNDGNLQSLISNVISMRSDEETVIEFALQVSERRRDALESKVRELEDKLFSQTQELDADYRTAKHLSILTPIMSRSRDSLILSAGMVAAKMDWLRIEVMRTRCFREILVKELDSEREMIALLKKQLAALQKSSMRGDEKMGGPDGVDSETVITCFVDPPS